MARLGRTGRAKPTARRPGAGVDAPFPSVSHGAGPATTIPVGAMFGLLSMPHQDAILSVVPGLLLLAVIGGLVYAFWREVRNDMVFLEPIELPHELARRCDGSREAHGRGRDRAPQRFSGKPREEAVSRPAATAD